MVINATPLGLHAGDPLPIRPEPTPGAAVALDLVYARGRDGVGPRACARAGLRAADGREMLVAQGAAAFERWFPGDARPGRGHAGGASMPRFD